MVSPINAKKTNSASVDEDVTNPMHSMFVFVYTIEVCSPGCPLVLLWCMCQGSGMYQLKHCHYPSIVGH